MTLIDLFLAPVFFVLIILLAYFFRSKLTNQLTQQYFLPGLILKCFGAVSVGVIYYFYYGGGDTTNYYENASHIHDALVQKPMVGLKMLFSTTFGVDIDGGEFSRYIYFRDDKASMVIVRLVAVLGLFCFHSYACIALCFALLSFSGVWVLYQEVYVKEYPEKSQGLAVAMLFVPSIFFWGSGILKDTVTLACMCWFIWGFYRVYILSRSSVTAFLIMGVSAWLLILVKVYIILCLVSMMAIWYDLSYVNRIKSWRMKAIVSPLVLLVVVGGGAYVAFWISSTSEKYSYDNIVQTAAVTSWWIRKASGETGAAYRLSVHFDGSLISIIRLIPEAFTVTFYRPFFWEVNNPVMLMSALESFGFFVGTIYVLVKRKLNSPLAIAGLLFSLVFGVAVGISTSNFGALVRYKIPCLLIYGTSLVLLNKKSSTGKPIEDSEKLIE